MKQGKWVQRRGPIGGFPDKGYLGKNITKIEDIWGGEGELMWYWIFRSDKKGCVENCKLFQWE